MKRNWDLIRKILSSIEALPDTKSRLDPDQIIGYSAEEVSYHMNMLDQAGLIDARCTKGADTSLVCVATSLTWQGHEFLERIKRETVWNKVKEVAMNKGVDLSIDVIKALSAQVIASLIS